MVEKKKGKEREGKEGHRKKEERLIRSRVRKKKKEGGGRVSAVYLDTSASEKEGGRFYSIVERKGGERRECRTLYPGKGN